MVGREVVVKSLQWMNMMGFGGFEDLMILLDWRVKVETKIGARSELCKRWCPLVGGDKRL